MATHGKAFGTIFNNDNTNHLNAIIGSRDPVNDYRQATRAALLMKPGIFVQCDGMPDAVIRRTQVGTCLHKHLIDATSRAIAPEIAVERVTDWTKILNSIFASNTDPLALTIEECRRENVPIVASYRMNDEHWGESQHLLSDFGRAHPDWRIPASDFEKSEHAKHGLDIPKYTGSMDPAIPEVYEHRMRLFTEAAREYDIDGIELDFRRWIHMVSDPLKNHVVLTRMVRQTRNMLDEVSRNKGRDRMILGVRVAPSLDSESNTFIYPGAASPDSPYLYDASCRTLGLDVPTWIKDEIVDYVCPSLFLGGHPGLPKTREFADLAAGTNVGIYPTVWNNPAWQGRGIGGRNVGLGDDFADRQAQSLFKYDLCTTVLKAYEDGADGISTFNWYCHLRAANLPCMWHEDAGDNDAGPGADVIMRYVYPMLADPDAVRRYRDQPWAVPADHLNAPAAQHQINHHGMMGTRTATQLSVYLENRVGALASLCDLIAKHSINLLAICAIDTVEEAVVRLVAENTKETCTILHDHGFRPVATDVLLVELDNRPGATGRIAARLSEAGINIDYIYASAHPETGKALLVLRTQQTDEALVTLSKK